MQKIYETDVYDFDSEYVVNLDEKDDTNFFVLSDEAVIAESSSNVNSLVSSDFDKGVFVFENADESLMNLKNSDYLYIQPSDDDIIAVCVEEVSVSDDVVTVIDSGNDIGEMFEFIKLESELENAVPEIQEQDIADDV